MSNQHSHCFRELSEVCSNVTGQCKDWPDFSGTSLCECPEGSNDFQSEKSVNERILFVQLIWALPSWFFSDNF